MARQHSDAGCIAGWNVVRIIFFWQLYLVIRHRVVVIIVIQWLHVRLATAAIDVIDHHSCTFNLHEQTLRTCHAALITAAIEVADLTSLQVPAGTDGHIRLVVTAKETAYLVGITAWIREGGIDTHQSFKAVIGQ